MQDAHGYDFDAFRCGFNIAYFGLMGRDICIFDLKPDCRQRKTPETLSYKARFQGFLKW